MLHVWLCLWSALSLVMRGIPTSEKYRGIKSSGIVYRSVTALLRPRVQRCGTVCLYSFGNRTSPSDNLNDRLKRLCLVSRVTAPCAWTLRALTRNLLTYILTYRIGLLYTRCGGNGGQYTFQQGTIYLDSNIHFVQQEIRSMERASAQWCCIPYTIIEIFDCNCNELELDGSIVNNQSFDQ